MWIELGIPRPGAVHPEIKTWINTDHIVRIEFMQNGDASVITTKPGGSDKTMFRGDDAQRIKLTMEHIKWLQTQGGEIQPVLDHEKVTEPKKDKKSKKVITAA